MSAPSAKGFTAADPDYAAVYAAVNFILNGQKPKRCEKMFLALQR
jgi:hypothetical protein